MIKKFPLLRGKARNKSIKEKPVIIHLKDLETFKTGQTVDVPSLIAAGLVDKRAKGLSVKILDDGSKLEKKLTVKVRTSKSVKDKVESLGGTVL